MLTAIDMKLKDDSRDLSWLLKAAWLAVEKFPAAAPVTLKAMVEVWIMAVDSFPWATAAGTAEKTTRAARPA